MLFVELLMLSAGDDIKLSGTDGSNGGTPKWQFCLQRKQIKNKSGHKQEGLNEEQQDAANGCHVGKIKPRMTSRLPAPPC